MAFRLGRLLLATCAVVALAGAAHATPITIFNTGVNAAGVPLADGTIGDPHYLLAAVPLGSSTDIRVRTSAGGWPIAPWLADDPFSAWIGPNNPDGPAEWECCGQTSGVGGPIGQYTYRTTFDLTGLDPATAVLTGQWSTDDTGYILLNNVATGITITAPGYSTWSPILINSGFVTGINTLDFVVQNWDDINQMGGPTGLRVEISGDAAPIPEPGTLLLLGTGLLGLARLVRKNLA